MKDNNSKRIMWNGTFYPNAPSNPPPIPGQSRGKPEPIDWNLVSVLDPEIIRRVKDFDSLQQFLLHFANANFVAGDSKILFHPLSIRLCQLLQICIDFMNKGQMDLKKLTENQADEIDKLKNELALTSRKLKKSEKNLKIKSQPFEKCVICGKKFVSMDYLEKHVYIKHSDYIDHWDCLRGKTKPKKNDDMSRVLKEIEDLRRNIKIEKGNSEIKVGKKDNLQVQLIQDISEAATDLNSSMKLWNVQKEQSKVFNIFNPKDIAENPAPVLFKENDVRIECNVNESEKKVISLFAEKQIDIESSLPTISVIESSLPTISIIESSSSSIDILKEPNDKQEIIEKAKKFIDHRVTVSEIKKEEILDAIDSIANDKEIEMNKIQGSNTDSEISLLNMRQSIGNDSEYMSVFYSYKEKLRAEYPISKDNSVSLISSGSQQNNIELYKTGMLDRISSNTELENHNSSMFEESEFQGSDSSYDSYSNQYSAKIDVHPKGPTCIIQSSELNIPLPDIPNELFEPEPPKSSSFDNKKPIETSFTGNSLLLSQSKHYNAHKNQNISKTSVSSDPLKTPTLDLSYETIESQNQSKLEADNESAISVSLINSIFSKKNEHSNNEPITTSIIDLSSEDDTFSITEELTRLSLVDENQGEFTKGLSVVSPRRDVEPSLSEISDFINPESEFSLIQSPLIKKKEPRKSIQSNSTIRLNFQPPKIQSHDDNTMKHQQKTSNLRNSIKRVSKDQQTFQQKIVMDNQSSFDACSNFSSINGEFSDSSNEPNVK